MKLRTTRWSIRDLMNPSGFVRRMQGKGFRGRRDVATFLIVGFLVFAGASANAQILTLVDRNSYATISLGSSASMTNWVVDGSNSLSQQSFWYRVGSNNPEVPINTIGGLSFSTPDAKTLRAHYDNGSYSVEVDYSLTGGSGGSGRSSIGETITISNATLSRLDFHFFAFANFDLRGSAAGDSVQLGKNLAGLFNEARQTKGETNVVETVVVPGATHAEAALSSTTFAKLNDGSPSVLNDTAGPVGPGDVTSAFQWDYTIEAHGSLVIVLRHSIHPAPP